MLHLHSVLSAFSGYLSPDSRRELPRVRRRATAWRKGRLSPWREYAEVVGVIAAVTVAGWFTPFSYRAFGHVYLLAVIVLCLRVGRWPVLFAAIVSAVTWNFIIMPPRLSFSVLHVEDALILGTYFVVALIAGQLTARIRSQELLERQRERRATALFNLTRALAAARTLDEAVTVALRQAEELFGARTALLLEAGNSGMAPHPAGSFKLSVRESVVTDWAARHRCQAGRFTSEFASAEGLHVPMLRSDEVLGVFVVAPPADVTLSTPEQRELIEGFAAQIALLIEREQWRAAGEREKILAESDRLHRTLLDSVSHELRTPLSVLRSASEKLATDDPARRVSVAAEIGTATRRLDRVVGNLLNQNRLEGGAIKPQLDWCDVRDLVNAARRGIGDALAGRPVKMEIPADLPLFRVDAPLMEQAIANLLLNAAVHTPAGSPVTVSAGTDEERKRVFITVADRGPGIAADVRELLFEKFQRGKDCGAGGVGLGLSIVRGFVAAHGGNVVADDHPGGGARFTISLPGAINESVPHE